MCGVLFVHLCSFFSPQNHKEKTCRHVELCRESYHSNHSWAPCQRYVHGLFQWECAVQDYSVLPQRMPSKKKRHS